MAKKRTLLGVACLMGLALAVLFGCKTEDSRLSDTYSGDIPDVPGSVEVKEVCLDGREFKNSANPVLDFHKKLAERAGFPAYYGNNWDALDEVLADQYGKFSLTILYIDSLKSALGEEQFKTMVEVFDTAVSRPDSSFEYTPVADNPAEGGLAASGDVALSASYSCE